MPSGADFDTEPNHPVALSKGQLATLHDLQNALRTNQIEAEIPEIVHAMLESLSARPSLCRGLIAAYLLEA